MSGSSLSHSDLAAYLAGESSPAAVALEIFPRRLLGPQASSAANRTIAVVDRDEFVGGLGSDEALDSLLLDDEMLVMVNNGDHQEFLRQRAEHLERYLRAFLDDRTGAGFEITAPLSDFNLDDESDEDASDIVAPTLGEDGE